jgi:hypothetical protein
MSEFKELPTYLLQLFQLHYKNVNFLISYISYKLKKIYSIYCLIDVLNLYYIYIISWHEVKLTAINNYGNNS